MENFKLKESFFCRDTHLVAKELLGKILVRKHGNGRVQAGRIVEVEAYHGFSDKASHASKSKTPRNKVMFGKGGYYYVYLIYGMYWNLNIVTGDKDFPTAILVRALEPIYDSGKLLAENTKEEMRELKKLSSGPGKLCCWMEIDKSFYGKSVESEELFIVNSISELAPTTFVDDNSEIVATKRVGVGYAGESADLDWRYYIKNNEFVSRQ